MTRRWTPTRLLALVCACLAVLVTGTGGSSAAPSASDVRSAEARLMELEKEFELVVEDYNLANETLIAVQARIGTTELEVNRLEKQMRRREAAAVALATELYKNGRAVSIEGVLSAASLAD